MMLTPLRNHPEASRLTSQTFWLIVLSALLLLGGGLFASLEVLESTTFVVLLGIFGGLWIAHVIDLRRHRDLVHRDPAYRHQRERRGF